MKIIFTFALFLLVTLSNGDEIFAFNNDTTFNESGTPLSSGEFGRLSPKEAYNQYRMQLTSKNTALRESFVCKFICACVRIREHNTQEFGLFKHLPPFQGKRNDEKWALYIESGIQTAAVHLQVALNNNKSGEYLRFGQSMSRSRAIANAHAREDNRTVAVLKQYRAGSNDSIFDMLQRESREWLFTRQNIEDMNVLITVRGMEKLWWVPLMTVNDTEFVVPLESSMKCYLSPEVVQSWVQANRKEQKKDEDVGDGKEEGRSGGQEEGDSDRKEEGQSDKKEEGKSDKKEKSGKNWKGRSKKKMVKFDKKKAGKVDGKEEKNRPEEKGKIDEKNQQKLAEARKVDRE